MNQPPIYIVTNRHILAANKKLPIAERQPAIRITRGKHGKPVYCDQFKIHGPCELLNGMGEAVMPCGATVAIMTEAAMTLFIHGREAVHLDASVPLDIAA